MIESAYLNSIYEERLHHRKVEGMDMPDKRMQNVTFRVTNKDGDKIEAVVSFQTFRKRDGRISTTSTTIVENSPRAVVMKAMKWLILFGDTYLRGTATREELADTFE